MKNLKVKSILFSLLAMMAVAVFLTSCEQEIIIEEDLERVRLSSLLAEYPEEITIDNWEEFVYAPQEVLDYFSQNELDKISISEETESNNTEFLRASNFGRVLAFRNNSWRGIRNVRMENNCSHSFTSHQGYYWINDVCDNNVCATYNTSSYNGVTASDLVLVQRHILGIAPFTQAWQVIAADVNRTGYISATDLAIMRQVIVHNIVDWPNSDNLIFLPEFLYDDAQDRMPDIATVLDYGTFPSCTTTSDLNRRVIKTGDVNGTFNF